MPITIWEAPCSRQGRIDEAINSYREALRINPDFKLAKDNLKNALAIQNKKIMNPVTD